MLLSSLLLKSVLKTFSKVIYKPILRSRGCPPRKSPHVLPTVLAPGWKVGSSYIWAWGVLGLLEVSLGARRPLTPVDRAELEAAERGACQLVGKGKVLWKDGRLPG